MFDGFYRDSGVCWVLEALQGAIEAFNNIFMQGEIGGTTPIHSDMLRFRALTKPKPLNFKP